MRAERPCSNGTVLGLWPLTHSLPVIGGALLVLFVVIEPEASRDLGLVERTLYWASHIGVALLGLLLASRLLMPGFMRRMPLVAALTATGLVASAAIVPILYGLEQVLPDSMQGADDDWLDDLEGRGFWYGLLSDYVEATPSILATWLAINLPLLFARPELNEPPDDGPGDGDARRREDDERRQRRERFLQSLPDAIGTDLIAISSDLHYLHVHTTLGRCMILGSLEQVAEAMGEAGLRVHRAHWVARGAVERLARHGNAVECVLSNGLRIPVSRRRRAEATAWFGKGARVVTLAPGERRKRG